MVKVSFHLNRFITKKAGKLYYDRFRPTVLPHALHMEGYVIMYSIWSTFAPWYGTRARYILTVLPCAVVRIEC